MDNFGTRLRALRLARGWTPEQAAEACGVNIQFYNRLEGRCYTTDFEHTLHKVVRAMDTTLDYLYQPQVVQDRSGKLPLKLGVEKTCAFTAGPMGTHTFVADTAHKRNVQRFCGPSCAALYRSYGKPFPRARRAEEMETE